jgi:hypothetical protein
VSKELIDRIPGRQTDRKTPLGELNWIFTAITDTIAWNSLPRALFQKLFRQVRCLWLCCFRCHSSQVGQDTIAWNSLPCALFQKLFQQVRWLRLFGT